MSKVLKQSYEISCEVKRYMKENKPTSKNAKVVDCFFGERAQCEWWP
jgi:hypothetical protein